MKCKIIIKQSGGDIEVIFMNVGDSREILVINNELTMTTEDHKPTNNEEKERIIKAGGYVSGGRVDGDLALSRAFGDFQYKNQNINPREQKVISLPEFNRYKFKLSSLQKNTVSFLFMVKIL